MRQGLILWWAGLLGVAAVWAQSAGTAVTAVVLPQVVPDTLEVDVCVQRRTLEWERWANGTFTFELPDALPRWQSLRVRVVPGSSALDTMLYRIEPFVVWRPVPGGTAWTRPRLGLTVYGPESFEAAQLVPWDTLIRLARVQIFSTDSSTVPYQLDWARPLVYYQAFAYKQRDEVLPWVRTHDNVELVTRTEYRLQPMRVPAHAVRDFRAEYIGDRKVRLSWQTQSEAFNRGFVLVRWWKPFSTADLVDSVVVADWQRVALLRGLGTSDTGRGYLYIDADAVKRRGEEYCYDLWSTDFQGVLRYHGQACTAIPHSVISFAQADPNPFADGTTIRYRLEDRVLLSITVYDLRGGVVASLMEQQEMERGTYTLEWRTPAYASQGLYDIVLIAYPVDDPSVELSRAVIKAQLIR
ncbi:MAG: hypothetical protein NZ949_01335 [Candidatus Kapabacteria bacterium]|nr:hypothetical protein [Candidatus Kapabacteria bacterium]MDW7996123.1 hypothetical protein [Bacteroidota bacterium]